MTIVYTVGGGSKHADKELRWSLRSICKYGTGIDRVILVGHIPDFIDRRTTSCIDMVEPSDLEKHIRIFRKLMRARDEFGLTREFLWSSDDHFYCKPTDFNNHPRYELVASLAKRLTEPPAQAQSYGKWRRSITGTARVLHFCGLPMHNTRGHFDTYCDPRYMDVAFDMMLSCRNSVPLGLEPSLLVNNLKFYHEPWAALKIHPGARDIKLNKTSDVDKIHDIVKEFRVFSCGDKVFENSDFETFMDGEYNDKCRYEI